MLLKPYKGDVSARGKGLLSEGLNQEAGKRITNEIRNSPEYLDAENPDAELDALIETLLNAPKGDDAPLPTTVATEAGSALAPVMARTEAQLATREKDLAVATEKGREQFVADSKEAILKLRQTQTPEGLQLAAAIEQRIVEQEAIDLIEGANTKLIAASERVFGNDETIPQDAALGKRFLRPSIEACGQLKDKTGQVVPRCTRL